VETAAGQEWLRLLVFGTIYVFGIKCGIGAETLSEFSTYCNCALQVGVSQECATKSGSCGQKGHSGISTATGKA
jgi:hypothetical protein